MLRIVETGSKYQSHYSLIRTSLFVSPRSVWLFVKYLYNLPQDMDRIIYYCRPWKYCDNLQQRYIIAFLSSNFSKLSSYDEILVKGSKTLKISEKTFDRQTAEKLKFKESITCLFLGAKAPLGLVRLSE